MDIKQHMTDEGAAPLAFDEARALRDADIMRGEVMAALFIRAARAVKRTAGRFVQAIEQAQTMRALASLDDHTLADIGMRRSDIPALCLGAATPTTQPTKAPEVEQREAA